MSHSLGVGLCLSSSASAVTLYVYHIVRLISTGGSNFLHVFPKPSDQEDTYVIASGDCLHVSIERSNPENIYLAVGILFLSGI